MLLWLARVWRAWGGEARGLCWQQGRVARGLTSSSLRMGMDRTWYFSASSLDSCEDIRMRFWLEEALKCFFRFLPWSELTVVRNFILLSGDQTMIKKKRCQDLRVKSDTYFPIRVYRELLQGLIM